MLNKLTFNLHSNSGSAIMQVITIAGVLSIMMYIMTTQMLDQQKQVFSVQEHIDKEELYKYFQSAIDDGSFCTDALINPTSTNSINLNELKSLASGKILIKLNDTAMKKFILNGLSLKITPNPTPGIKSFDAQFTLSFKSDQFLRPMKPIILSTMVHIDPANKIESCGASKKFLCDQLNGVYDPNVTPQCKRSAPI